MARGCLKQHPPHLELLSDDDKQMYMKIMNAIQAPTLQSKRNKRLTEFEDMIEAIEVFENHEDIEKWKRYLACGLFRFENGIAVNISTLKQLIHRCKSSINGSLKALGYNQVISKASSCKELLQAIPYLAKRANELRQWTVRYKNKEGETKNEEIVAAIPSIIVVEEPTEIEVQAVKQ